MGSDTDMCESCGQCFHIDALELAKHHGKEIALCPKCKSRVFPEKFETESDYYEN